MRRQTANIWFNETRIAQSCNQLGKGKAFIYIDAKSQKDVYIGSNIVSVLGYIYKFKSVEMYMKRSLNKYQT